MFVLWQKLEQTADRQTGRPTYRLTDRETDQQTDQLGQSVLLCLRALTDKSNAREAPFNKFFPKLCLK